MPHGIAGSTPPCQFSGCGKLAIARGWCSTHYKRWQKYGDPAKVYERWELTPRPVRVSKPCKVDGCDRQATTRTALCEAHYKRVWKYGDPAVLKSPRGVPVTERLAAKITRTLTCWLWTGHVTTDGYGHIGVGPRVLAAHRVAYELAVGPIPEGYEVDHLCRVRNCVRPEHLEAVTVAENRRRANRRRYRS